jgi:hypothetical protein
MTEPESTHEFSVTRRLQDLATVIGFGVLGWALCGFAVWIGGQFFSMNTTLLLHAALVPVIFAAISLMYFKWFGAMSPLQTASIFLAVVVTLNIFVVSLFIERNFNMFKSVIGTWVPFALILVTTYLSGVYARRRRDTA